MGRVSQGDLDVQITPTTKDEVGLLTESFNQMVRDLKQSHEALKEAEGKYRRIFENSKDMIFITTYDGRFIEVNQTGADMLGYTNEEELVKIYVRDSYIDPNGRKRFQDEIAKDGFIKDFEIKLKRKDGTPIDCLITATVSKDGEGHILGYEGIVKNISVRKKMEEELVRRTEELQILYDLSALINQTLDIDTVLRTALEKAMSLMGFEMGSIHLLNEIGDTLEMKFDHGQPPLLTENIKFFKVGEGVCGKAVQLKQPIILSVDQYPTSRLIPFFKNEGIETLVGIPLLVKERVIGAISLVSRSPREISPREVNLLESIGNQIGLALENASLFSNVAKAKSEWETTFNAVTDHITIRDKDYRIIRSNQAALKRSGKEAKEAIGKKCYEIFHNRDKPCEGCNVAEAIKTKKPTSFEGYNKYLNGIFQYFIFPVCDEAGEVVAVAELIREITEQKRLEMEKEVINHINKILASSLDVREVMKAVHSELKRILDSERMAITLFGEGGGFEYFALEKENGTGKLVSCVTYPRMGTPFEKVIDTGLPVIVPDTAKSDFWIDQKVLEEGIQSVLVFPLEYKERIIGSMNFGSREPNHFSQGLFDLLRQIASGLAISIQNALLLDEIKTSEEKYRIVVESALDGVLVVEEDYRFKYVNERLTEIVGYTVKELIGMDFRNCLDEGSKQLVADRFMRRQNEEEVPPRYEFNVIRKDGEIKNVEISSTIMKDSKGNINTIAFLKDITEKRKMEEQLLQTEKLRALGEMASGVAHDFNNALAVILGNTQLLLYSAQDKELRETLRTIEKVARDSAQTVRRLQDFTRKRVHQELYKLDINGVIQDAIEITKPKWKDEAQGKGINIEMISNLGGVPSVGGNTSEMREVVSNMIFNAIEAMPEGGKIEFRTFQRKEKVYIQISDTGIGMAEEVRKKVFEPFFTTKPFRNTGLGLSMSYGIIKRFGGGIEVKSKVGYGTTFTITLPIEREGVEKLPDISIVEKRRRARVLVIDDEEPVRSILARTLSQVKHEVTVAENGEEGIRLFKEKEFDIVLTDLGMPGMSGWEVCRMIKQIRPRTPVGMITGWGMEFGKSKLEEYGLDFLIPKPFEFNQILKVMIEALESKENLFLS
jgi:PAS domain S-box-containing protein